MVTVFLGWTGTLLHLFLGYSLLEICRSGDFNTAQVKCVCILRESSFGNGEGKGKQGKKKMCLESNGWGGVGKIKL